MSVIEFRLLYEVRAAVGDAARVVLPPAGRRLGDILEDILAGHASARRELLDDSGELREGLVVLLNGRSLARARDLGSLVLDGDTVTIFPAVGGG